MGQVRRSRLGLRLGSRERHSLRSSLKHVRRLASARRKQRPQRLQRRIELVIALTPPEGSSFISRGTSRAQIFK